MSEGHELHLDGLRRAELSRGCVDVDCTHLGRRDGGLAFVGVEVQLGGVHGEGAVDGPLCRPLARHEDTADKVLAGREDVHADHQGPCVPVQPRPVLQLPKYLLGILPQHTTGFHHPATTHDRFSSPCHNTRPVFITLPQHTTDLHHPATNTTGLHHPPTTHDRFSSPCHNTRPIFITLPQHTPNFHHPATTHDWSSPCHNTRPVFITLPQHATGLHHPATNTTGLHHPPTTHDRSSSPCHNTRPIFITLPQHATGLHHPATTHDRSSSPYHNTRPVFITQHLAGFLPT